MTEERDPEYAGAHLLGHLLWEVSARTAVLGEAALAGTPLTLPALDLLDRIGVRPGITIAEIARNAPKSQQAISQVAARLDRLGFIERRLTSPRGVGLHITDAGARARTAGNAIEQASEARLEATLGSERYERLRALLEEARAIIVAL